MYPARVVYSIIAADGENNKVIDTVAIALYLSGKSSQNQLTTAKLYKLWYPERKDHNDLATAALPYGPYTLRKYL